MTLAGNRIGRLIGGGVLALGLAACGTEPATPLASTDQLQMTSDMVGIDTDTYLTTDGVKSGLIHADTAFFFEDSTVVHMRGVTMTMYTDQGAVRATVTSEAGRYEQRSQQMHATGNVVLVMPGEGRTVESGELNYNPNDGRIWSDSATTYRNGDQTTRGTCFNSDLSFKNYTVCNIRGTADVGGAG